MATIKDTTLIKALIARGFGPSEALRIADGVAPAAASPVSAPAAPEKAKNDFFEKVIRARVGCAYGVKTCGSFAPNGVGSKQHTTCPKGRKALKAARA